MDIDTFNEHTGSRPSGSVISGNTRSLHLAWWAINSAALARVNRATWATARQLAVRQLFAEP